MTKRRENEAVLKAMDEADSYLPLPPTTNPVVEAETASPPGGTQSAWTENRERSYLDAVQAARERFALLREVLTYTHATARLPADLLRRIEEAVS